MSVSPVFLRFLVVGGTFSLIYAATTSALIAFAGAPPLATGVLVWLACIPPAYWCQSRLAFGVTELRRTAFPTYVATQLASVGLVSVVSAVAVTRVFWVDTAIYLAASAAAAVLSFVVARLVTFAPVRRAG